MRILVAGGEGQLGREFQALSDASTDIVACARGDLDITRPDSIQTALSRYQPHALINAAAYTAVDKAEQEEHLAMVINADGAANLSSAAKAAGIPFLHVSTDYVFAGDKPHGEVWKISDPCYPQSAYGRSKRAGEERILQLYPENSLILRTSWVFGRYGNNFPKTMLRLGQERDELRVVADQWGGPTHATDIAITLLATARAMREQTLDAGIYHYSGQPFCSWYDFANAVFACAKEAGLRVPTSVIPITTADYPVPAKRPANSALDSQRLCSALGVPASDWHAGVQQLVQHMLNSTH